MEDELSEPPTKRAPAQLTFNFGEEKGLQMRSKERTRNNAKKSMGKYMDEQINHVGGVQKSTDVQ